MFRTLKKLLLGKPLPSRELCEQKLTKRVALAIFSSDALSSVAYATEEMLLILILAGVGALHFSLPIAFAIGLLLIILISSYSEIIRAYPEGGGAYVVAKENLGKYPGLVAGASLLIDYVLTVAVSSATAVAALTSAFPQLYPYKVLLCLVCIFIVTLINLRGIKESGFIFSLPTYLFIGSFFILIVSGFYQYFVNPQTIVVVPPETLHSLEVVNAFLLLRAFSSGCAALTGVEAISNGVPAFRAPESKNAIITLVGMGCILLFLFLGITELARFYEIIPSEQETVVSQLARGIFGKGFFYYLVQISTALILFLAANTSFSGFPRLSSLIAQDGFLPRQLGNLGDRLAFSNGIIILGLCAGGLIVLFQAKVHSLIPLYALGVFISFTLAQSGMLVHWIKEKGKGWWYRFLINGLGALATGVATFVIGITKFTHGAWMVLVFIPLLIFIFLIIRSHYDSLKSQLSPKGFVVTPPRLHRAVIPLSAFHKGTIRALAYAKSISSDVRAVYVSLDHERTDRFKDIWREWGQGIPLIILESQYRAIVEPLTHYIDDLLKEEKDQLITVVLPEFVPAKWWQQILHNQTALLIRGILYFKKGVVTTSVRHFLEY